MSAITSSSRRAKRTSPAASPMCRKPRSTETEAVVHRDAGAVKAGRCVRSEEGNNRSDFGHSYQATRELLNLGHIDVAWNLRGVARAYRHAAGREVIDPDRLVDELLGQRLGHL